MNNQIEIDNVKIAKEIILTTGNVNLHPTEARYILALQIPNEWPYFLKDIQLSPTTIPWLDSKSLEGYIKQNEKELTHIIVDDNKKLPEFLLDVYYNEHNYDFLVLKKDFGKLGFDTKLKIFKIDYDKFYLSDE